jgi:hypothetical protein
VAKPNYSFEKRQRELAKKKKKEEKEKEKAARKGGAPGADDGSDGASEAAAAPEGSGSVDAVAGSGPAGQPPAAA